MSDAQIVALLLGIFTFLGTILGTIRLMKSDKMTIATTQAASLLAGYNAIVADLQNEVARVRKSCQEQIESMREEFETERAVWFAERQEIRAEYKEEKKHMQAEIETLKAQVYALIEANKRPRSSRTRNSDKEQ